MCVCAVVAYHQHNYRTTHSIAQRFNSSSLDLKLVSEWFGFYISFFLFLSFFCSPQHNLASNTSNWTIVWLAVRWCTTWFASGNAWCCRNYEHLRCKYSLPIHFSVYKYGAMHTLMALACAVFMKKCVWLFSIMIPFPSVRSIKGYDEFLGAVCGATAEGVFIS